MVYKAHLVRPDTQGGLQTSPVAVKVLKGNLYHQVLNILLCSMYM